MGSVTLSMCQYAKLTCPFVNLPTCECVNLQIGPYVDVSFCQFDDLSIRFPTESKSTRRYGAASTGTRATFGTTWSLTSCHTSIVTIGNGTGGRTSGSWSRGLDVAEMFLSFFHSFFFITWTRAPLLRGRSEPARLRKLRSHGAPPVPPCSTRPFSARKPRAARRSRSLPPAIPETPPCPRQPGKSRTVTSGL